MSDPTRVKREFIQAAIKRAEEGGYPIVEPTAEDTERDLGWWIRVFDAKAFLFSENGSATWLFPPYRLKVIPLAARVVVSVDGVVLADSTRCLEFHETAHPVQIYIPRSDVDMSKLSRSETLSYCPFKNLAAHYSVTAAGRAVPDAFWSYEQVYERLPPTGNADGIPAIKGMLSPYQDKVTVVVEPV